MHTCAPTVWCAVYIVSLHTHVTNHSRRYNMYTLTIVVSDRAWWVWVTCRPSSVSRPHIPTGCVCIPMVHLSKFHHTLYKEHTLVQTLSVPGACLAAGSPRALMGLDAHSQLHVHKHSVATRLEHGDGQLGRTRRHSHHVQLKNPVATSPGQRCSSNTKVWLATGR